MAHMTNHAPAALQMSEACCSSSLVSRIPAEILACLVYGKKPDLYKDAYFSRL